MIVQIVDRKTMTYTQELAKLKKSIQNQIARVSQSNDGLEVVQGDKQIVLYRGSFTSRGSHRV